MQNNSQHKTQVLVQPKSRNRSGIRKNLRRRAGTIIFVLVACLFMMVAFSVIAIDSAYMQLTRTELRTATDAAARAAGRVMASNGTETEARRAAITAGQLNTVAGKPLTIRNTDIQFGNSGRIGNGRFTFNAGGTPTNSVRIAGSRLSNSADGHVPLLLGRVLGIANFETSAHASVTRAERQIMLVIDRSGSMMLLPDQLMTFPPFRSQLTPPDPFFSRWADLTAATDAFFNALDKTTTIEQVGMVSYSDNASFDADFTTNYSHIRHAIGYYSSIPINGMTSIGEGLRLARNELVMEGNAKPLATRTIVLLTDGRSNVGTDPLVEALRCADAGIVVHTVSFTPFADFLSMQLIADTTGGRYFNAPNRNELTKAFKEIADLLPPLLIE